MSKGTEKFICVMILFAAFFSVFSVIGTITEKNKKIAQTLDETYIVSTSETSEYFEESSETSELAGELQ